MEPAHDRTLFCFLLGFFVKEDLLEVEGSMDCMGIVEDKRSGVGGADSTDFRLGSFSEDAALVGRDLGEVSPEPGSWPKKAHFFAERGVEGAEVALATAASKSNGIELRRLGVSGERVASRSVDGSADFGRISVV